VWPEAIGGGVGGVVTLGKAFSELAGAEVGKQRYCVVELTRGEDAADVTRKLRELAAQVDARGK
jgi:hypothetical protein